MSTGIAISASGSFITRFEDLLAVLLYLFTPWTAINLIDFYVVRKGHYSIREIFNPHGMYGRWNWRGLTAYAVGFLSMIPFFSSPMYEGPVARALGRCRHRDADRAAGLGGRLPVGLPLAGPGGRSTARRGRRCGAGVGLVQGDHAPGRQLRTARHSASAVTVPGS